LKIIWSFKYLKIQKIKLLTSALLLNKDKKD